MTFDARTAPGEKPGPNKDLIFGIAVLLIVGGAFFFTLMMSGGSEPKIAKVEREVSVAEVVTVPQTAAALSTPEAEAYFKVLQLVDDKAHASLMKKLRRAAKKPASVQYTIVQTHAQKVLKNNAADLSKARTKHVDGILTLTQTRLKQAARSGSPWCSGEQYTSLMTGGMESAEAMSEEIMEIEGPLQAYTFEVLSLMMEATLDARNNPMQHGPVTNIDDAAVQGVMMSLVSEPQIMPILMAANTGADPEPMIAVLNVCDLAATAIIATKTLPQDTKGRMWAKMVKDAELGGADLNQFNGLVGF